MTPDDDSRDEPRPPSAGPRPRRAVIDSGAPTVRLEPETQTDYGEGASQALTVEGRFDLATDDPIELPEEPVAGRYRAVRALGQGSGGVVFEALDEIAGEAVALKLLWPGSHLSERRVGREVAALRVLDLPGVARLLDEGVHGGRPFIVMTLVRGHPFPGDLAVPSWHALATPTVALLEILHRVHELGIVHRDLKPSNVLVDLEGRPVILDFGLARGSRLGETITRSGALLGTPRYLSPEQLQGLPTDARSDLYAVGVMLFEALAGRPPHMAGSLAALRFGRLGTDAPPLAGAAPEAPPGVAAVVDWLLAREPDDRPQTAAEVLTALQTEADSERGELLPWLGSRTPIQTAVAAVRAGRSLDLGGPPGHGRTRILREALREVGDGVEVAHLGTGERPFESLGELVDLGAIAGPDPERLFESVDRALEERLRSGLVVVADDVERMDRWTSEALERCRGAGTVLRVVGVGEAHDLATEALTEEDLRDLFHGPDRLLHLQEDGARELFGRTSGVPLRVVREVAAWVGAGFASWRDDRLALSRDSLRRLRTRPHLTAGDAAEWLDKVSGPLAEVLAWVSLAWPHATPELLQEATERPGWELGVELAELALLGAVARREGEGYRARGPALDLPRWPFERLRAAHQKLAELIPPGAPGRLAHLIAAGTAPQIAEEAMTSARRAQLDAQPGQGVGLVLEALPAVQALGAASEEAKLLVELARLALAERAPDSIRRAHYELERRVDLDPTVGRMDALLVAALELTKPAPERALELADGVGPLEPPELELERQTVRLYAATALGSDRLAALLAALAPWADNLPPELRGHVDGWMGVLCHLRQDYDGAIAHHRLAEARRRDAGRVLEPPFRAAIALLEAFRLDEAEEVARAVLVEARRRRLPVPEAQAELVGRMVRYRRGDPLEAAVDLVEAADALESPEIAGAIALNEAAIAWRNRELALAADLAHRAREIHAALGNELAAGLAHALELAARGQADEGDVARLVERARAAVVPRLGAQILGLLSRVEPTAGASWRDDARRLAASTPESHWGQRLEVLSLEESVTER